MEKARGKTKVGGVLGVFCDNISCEKEGWALENRRD